MNLRKKTVLTVGFSIFVLTALLYLILYNIFLNSFKKLEYNFAENDIMTVLDSFSGILEELKSKSADWAIWDDNYNFVQTGDLKFVESNLTDYTFNDLKLNYILILNKDGKWIYKHAHDLNTGKETRFPESLDKILNKDSLLLKHEDLDSIHTGLVNLPEGVLLLISRPILTSQHKGPVQGTLVFGRYFNDRQLEILTRLTQHVLVAKRYDDENLPENFQKAKEALNTGQSFYIQSLNANIIAAYALVRDIFGKPALIIRMDEPRSIFKQGLFTLRYLVLSVVLSGLVFLIVILLLLEKFILSPLARLSSEVKVIAESEDLSRRVTEKGKDELSDFAITLNKTLAQLEEMHREIKNSEEWFRILFEYAPDAIYLNDLRGQLVDANRKTLQLLGLSKEEILGKNLKTLRLLPEASLQDLTTLTHEFLFITPANVETVLEIQSYPITYQNRNLILNIARDITERKSLERMKEEFVFTVSHELRTPLAIVKALLGNLQAGTAGELNDKQQESLGMTVRNVNRLTRLINDLLDFSRLESGKAKINRKACKIASVLEEALGDFREKSLTQNIMLESSIQEHIPTMYVDSDMLLQVVFNLLDNAFRYAKSKVMLSCRLQGSELEVKVCDDGEGIHKEGLSVLFNKFQQINRPSGGAGYKGTGLGLAICKEIIRLHQGKIWAESEVGKGACFVFTLPLAPEAIKSENN